MALNDSAITCPNSAVTFDELLLSAIGTDSSGKPTLRVIDSNDTGTNFVTCDKGLTKEEVLRQLFALDSNGKVAIRISIP